MDENVKTKCCELLPKLIDEISGNEKVIVAGDFNLLFDLKGAEHLKMLTNFYNDATQSMVTLDRKPIIGTFFGYSHDRYSSLDPTHLDRIFLTKDLQATQVTVDTNTYRDAAETYDVLDKRDLYPSDHYPLLTTIII